MDLFDIIMLSFIAIVGFAAVSSNIKEKMEERGKESGKEKELKKNIILCALGSIGSFANIVMVHRFFETGCRSSNSNFCLS